MTLSTPTAGTVELPVIAQGDAAGVPVVLLPGVSDSARSYLPLLVHLPPSLRVLALTLRGHGDAPKPDGGYDLAQMTADVVAALDRHGVDRAVVAGHSMGSIVAAELALTAPERVRGLVLMGARPTWRDPVGDELCEVFLGLRDPIDPALLREFQESTLAGPVPDAFLETVVSESLKLPARVWHAVSLGDGPMRGDHAGRLGEIAVPTLVARGGRDDMASDADLAALVAGVPGAESVVYPDAGHAFHWEDPAAFARDLLAFARRC
jgi:non-heme chloroperoxidase